MRGLEKIPSVSLSHKKLEDGIMKRNCNIELARIIASFIVVCLHTMTWYKTNEGYLINSLLIRCFFFDGVPLFWYIMGYYLFINPKITFRRRLGRTFKVLLLPAFCVMLFSQIWQDWILSDIGQVSFFSCLNLHSLDFHNLISNILQWDSGMTFGGHFWYVFSYLQVILWTPLLKYIFIDEDSANRCRHYLMLLSFLYVLNRDISNLFTINIGGSTYTITVYSVISATLLYVFIGYETYLRREWFQKYAKVVRACGFGVFVIFNFIKFSLSEYFMRVGLSDSHSHFLGIGTLLTYLASYGLFVAILCLNIPKDTTREKLILNIGRKTLGIYLIHGLVFRKIGAIGIRDMIYTPYLQLPNSLPVEIFCTLVYAIIVFSVCYFIVFAYDVIRRYLPGRKNLLVD